MFSRILIIQLGDIGDVVLATPTFRAVKTAFPQARVSVLVRNGCGSLLSAEPYLSAVLESARSRGKLSEISRDNVALLRDLRSARYDLVIDLRTGDRGAILAWLTGAPVRVSRESRDDSSWRKLAFTHLIPDPGYAPPPVHPGAEQSLRIVRTLGIDTPDSTPRLEVAPENRASVRELISELGLARGARWVTINPFSRWKYKEWGYDKWCEVIDRLWDAHGLPSLLVGSVQEAAAAEEIIRSRSDHAFNLAGKTSLGELAALIGMSALHLGVDSAAPHIASAVGTPTVTVYGPSNWRSWTVEDSTHRVVTAGMDCVPCGNKGCNGTERSICLEVLGVDAVTAAIDEVLRNAGPEEPGQIAGP